MVYFPLDLPSIRANIESRPSIPDAESDNTLTSHLLVLLRKDEDLDKNILSD